MVGTRISLRGEGVTFAAPAARLRLFDGSLDLSKPILVLAPHPDDAEIAAFGLYANRNASVVTVTAGNAGAPTYEAVFDDPGDLYLFKGRIRVIDSITIPWQGGFRRSARSTWGTSTRGLPRCTTSARPLFRRCTVRTRTSTSIAGRTSARCCRCGRASRSGAISSTIRSTLLKKVKPAVIVAPHPQLDTHRDHQFTTVALSEALARWNRPVTLLLYTNHADGNRYPYGPAGTLLSLPPPPPGDVRARPRLLTSGVAGAAATQAVRARVDARPALCRRRASISSREKRRARLAPEKPGPEPDITYLRRGPRSNELFFVYDRESFGTMIKAFLASRAPRISRQYCKTEA